MTRRDFLYSAAVTAAAKPPAGEIKPALYSVTYIGLWYRGDPLAPEQLIERATKFGYEAIELEAKRPHASPLDWPRKRCQEYRKRAAGAGVPVVAVGGMNDFSSPIPEHREAQLLYVRDLIRMTADLEAKVLRLFLGWIGATPLDGGGGTYESARRIWEMAHEGIPDERTWAWCRQGLIEAARWAGDSGVTLALQNHKPVIATYQDTLRMVREVGSPHLKVCLDAPIMEKKDAAYLTQAVQDTGALQVHSHFGGEYETGPDGSPRLRDQFNKDGNFYVPFVKALLDTGYRGYISYELCHPLPVVGGKTVGLDFVDENARLALQFMRDTLAEAKRS